MNNSKNVNAVRRGEFLFSIPANTKEMFCILRKHDTGHSVRPRCVFFSPFWRSDRRLYLLFAWKCRLDRKKKAFDFLSLQTLFMHTNSQTRCVCCPQMLLQFGLSSARRTSQTRREHMTLWLAWTWTGSWHFRTACVCVVVRSLRLLSILSFIICSSCVILVAFLPLFQREEFSF